MNAYRTSLIITFITVVFFFGTVISVPSSDPEELTCPAIREKLRKLEDLKLNLENKVTAARAKENDFLEKIDMAEDLKMASECLSESLSEKELVRRILERMEKAPNEDWEGWKYLEPRERVCYWAYRNIHIHLSLKNNVKNYKDKLNEAQEEINRLDSLAQSKNCKVGALVDLKVSIAGLPSVFVPEFITTTNSAEFKAGIWELKGMVSVSFSKMTEGVAGNLSIVFDTRQIKGPGTYSFNKGNSVFEHKDGAATMMFSSSLIRDEDEYNTEVVFVSNRGKINLTAFSKYEGERLVATFSAEVSGERVTGIDKNGNYIYETITGSISGSFDLRLTNSQIDVKQ